MKNIKSGLLLFIYFILLVLLGLNGECFQSLKAEVQNTYDNILSDDYSDSARLSVNVEEALCKSITYHDLFMDINSLKENILGTRIIKKGDTVIAKSESNSLIYETLPITAGQLDEVSEKIKALQRLTEDKGIHFLYCAVPTKEYYEKAPSNITNCMRTNYDDFIKALQDKDIPYTDLSGKLEEEGIKSEDMYYKTDHHWKIYPGLVAAEGICEALSEKYDFSYDTEIFNIDNYNRKEYQDWFLGSRGKKTGRLFTWEGAEDFELITPKFETNMTEEQPIKDESRTGTFEDTVIFGERLKKGYYDYNTYAAYSGGDYRIQIMKNNNAPDGEKILMIRDSFACALAPFLSLQTSELHICDIRDFDYFVGDRINIENYINKIDPDYVIVLYSGIESVEEANGKYEFINY